MAAAEWYLSNEQEARAIYTSDHYTTAYPELGAAQSYQINKTYQQASGTPAVVIMTVQRERGVSEETFYANLGRLYHIYGVPLDEIEAGEPSQ